MSLEEKKWRTDLDNMAYIIRDEGIEPFKWAVDMGYNVEVIKKAQSEFVKELSEIISKLYKNANIHIINLNNQLEDSYKHLGSERTISIDTYFKGTYNLEITRLFKVVKGKTEFIEMTNRTEFDTIENQIKHIEPGEYTIVDDDAVGGRTIREITKQLEKHGLKVKDKFLLMDLYRNKHTEPILDVVDARDFILGASCGGLTVQANDNSILRVPYILPFVDITDKANIPEEHKVDVAMQLWQMNIDFWTKIDSKITLDQLGSDIVKIMGKMYVEGGDTPVIEAFKIAKALTPLYKSIISI